ncbi:MAG: SpoVR family protein [Theionarchaea archaeon]|nr:SpoVR family protein [Theionarchaea archaeon]
MQEKDLPQENEIQRFENFENPEIYGFLDSEYCPSNFKKFYETAQKNAQIDNFIGVDVIAAGFISNFLFWLSGWICANLPKVVLLLYEAREDITSLKEEDQKPDLADIKEDVYKSYGEMTKKIENLGDLDLDKCGITSDLPEQFIKHIVGHPHLSQTEKEFIIFWGKVREFASDDLGIYMRDWPKFAKYDVFKSKLIRFSYPEARRDIENPLETPDEDELKHILAPFYHPREGTFILFDADKAAEQQDMKKVLSPSVETLLSYAIHECIGHGFFYMHTAVGDRLSSSKAVQLLMTERVEPSFEIERSEEVEELRLLRKETQILREGFAYWVQLCLLRKLKRACPDLNLDEEIEKVSQLISEEVIEKSNPYSVGFHLFKKIGEHNGELCVARALQIACNMKSSGNFEQRLINISETFEKVKEDTGFPTFRKNDLNWFDHAVNHAWNYKLPRIRFSPVMKFSYVKEQNSIEW